MTASAALSGRITELFLNGRWIANTNYKEQLEATGYELAVRKTGSLNTIAALTFHINYYLEGLLKVSAGGPLDISDQYSFDLPYMRSEADWQALTTTLLRHAAQFAIVVAELPDHQLSAPFVDEKYGTWHRNIEGVIEHSYYHLGQIVLLRKL